ncbi:MAG TPA: dienelactone hydrolase family protein, partial [Phototrophicaceae bacterium]|nr:dienelactone hydrolase family protein [Phototrophicaceae bacterium]
MGIISRMVDFPVNGTSTPGYLAQPDDGGVHPGVVVIQEWWGLVDHIKDVTERFAQAGYVALAPDLYHGEKSTEPDDARR